MAPGIASSSSNFTGACWVAKGSLILAGRVPSNGHLHLPSSILGLRAALSGVFVLIMRTVRPAKNDFCEMLPRYSNGTVYYMAR